jgi:hypothetical protein
LLIYCSTKAINTFRQKKAINTDHFLLICWERLLLITTTNNGIDVTKHRLKSHRFLNLCFFTINLPFILIKSTLRVNRHFLKTNKTITCEVNVLFFWIYTSTDKYWNYYNMILHVTLTCLKEHWYHFKSTRASFFFQILY